MILGDVLPPHVVGLLPASLMDDIDPIIVGGRGHQQHRSGDKVGRMDQPFLVGVDQDGIKILIVVELGGHRLHVVAGLPFIGMRAMPILIDRVGDPLAIVGQLQVFIAVLALVIEVTQLVVGEVRHIGNLDLYPHFDLAVIREDLRVGIDQRGV